jgi:inner membrane protein
MPDGHPAAMRFPLFGRFVIVAGVALALLLPLALIREKVAERRDRADSVQKRFIAEAGGAQAVAGPFLALTCEEGTRACPTGIFVPATLQVKAEAPVEQRYRGIYPIRFYRAKFQIAASFELPPPPAQGAWKEAFLILGVSEPRGIRQIGSDTLAFAPGTLDTRMRSGAHARLGRYAGLRKDALEFAIPLELVGSGRLDIAPVARDNTVSVVSAWPHPSFVGAHSPDQREVSRGGFSALWRVSQFAAGGGAFWVEAFGGDKLFTNGQLIGVSLVEPVNPYSMSYRAVEYGILFVVLTFSLFGLVELVWGVKLHPVHYALTGLALSVFFLLLIALSEHIHFGLAYLAASSACVALLGLYLRHPLGSGPRSVLFTGLFAALYGSLYVLLKSEDHSLLLGSLLVFGVLAAVMLLTRKIDWAQLSRRLDPAPAPDVSAS